MSFKWPNKDPDEILDYTVDWSRYLGDKTISSVTWFIDDADGVKTEFTDALIVNGLQKVSQSNTNTVASIFLGLGTANVKYKLYCLIIDSNSLTSERSCTARSSTLTA